MDKVEFLTIFPTFENIEVVKKTLPTVIAETKRNDARLIVHDSSIEGRDEKWAYLRELNKKLDFFLILSDNLSMAHARNMCLALGQSMYSPDYICMIEDDHALEAGLIKSLIQAMKKYYGKISPNGLRFGLFTGCGEHHYAKRHLLEDGHAYIDKNSELGSLGGANSCFRCAPTAHWNNVLKGYDTDEFLISTYQTKHLCFRNYHKGFTSLIVENGKKVYEVKNNGRGTSSGSTLKLWDETYTASDARSAFLGKEKLLDNKKIIISNASFEHSDGIKHMRIESNINNDQAHKSGNYFFRKYNFVSQFTKKLIGKLKLSERK